MRRLQRNTVGEVEEQRQRGIDCKLTTSHLSLLPTTNQPFKLGVDFLSSCVTARFCRLRGDSTPQSFCAGYCRHVVAYTFQCCSRCSRCSLAFSVTRVHARRGGKRRPICTTAVLPLAVSDTKVEWDTAMYPHDLAEPNAVKANFCSVVVHLHHAVFINGQHPAVSVPSWIQRSNHVRPWAILQRQSNACLSIATLRLVQDFAPYCVV
jgi:hypothetical protein